MITRTGRKIIVDGKERNINTEMLCELSKKYLPEEMPEKEKDCFIDEVIFRIEGLSFEMVDTSGKEIEEYFFAACLAYLEENGLKAFLDETDDGNIFEYYGATL